MILNQILKGYLLAAYVGNEGSYTHPFVVRRAAAEYYNIYKCEIRFSHYK